MTATGRICIAGLAALLLWADTGLGGVLILKRAWIEENKDRATIDASFVVDAVHPHPNPAKKDGDMHVAGHSDHEVGLPMVAEMVNAVDASPDEKQAINAIRAARQSGNAVKISGAWRLWFEHPAAKQTQFAPFHPVKDDTNPDHSFEIHPITKFDGIDITSTFHFVPGFEGYDAAKAFGRYEKGSVSVSASASSVTLESKKIVYNYTHFRMHLRAKPKKLVDGGFVGLADVTEEGEQDEDEVIAEKVRMIFIPGTPPWKVIAQGIRDGTIGDGSELDALGIPRVNLNAISTFAAAAGNTPVPRKLPYEIIIVGLK